MADDTAVGTLREIVTSAAYAIAAATTVVRLDGELVAAGLPPSPGEDSKAKRAARSAAAVPDSHLRDIAVGLLNADRWLRMSDYMAVQDLVWAEQRHLQVDKRTRREIARILPGEVLTDHYRRFRGLLATLFDLHRGEITFGHLDHSLGGQIDQHFHRNYDWTVEQLFDELGALDASDRRFALLLQGIVSGDTVPDEKSQRQLVEAINPVLASAGLELREMGSTDGYPTFELVAILTRAGRPKQLIFASPRKPDLRLIDAIDNDLEALDPSDEVLVYDRPIGPGGLRWRDLQAWWKESHRLEDDEQAKRELWRRLGQSLPQDSPPQSLLFKLYHKIYRDDLPNLPALLPEVWRHWDPKTVKARGKDALVQFRMDFLILAPAGARIVLEVDGQTHYAREVDVAPEPEHRWRPDPQRYAHTMTQSRDLTLAGYEVYRFGARDLQNENEAKVMLTAFFDSLYRRHRVVLPSRPS